MATRKIKENGHAPDRLTSFGAPYRLISTTTSKKRPSLEYRHIYQLYIHLR